MKALPFHWIAVWGIVSLIFGVSRAQSPDPVQVPEVVVAMVQGVPVTKDQIEPTPESVRRRFAAKHKREAEASDGEELQRIKDELERSALVSLIRSRVRKNAIERLGIQVSEAEVLARWEGMKKGQDVSGALRSNHESMKALVEALDSACTQQAAPDEAYERYLRGRISRMQWEGHLKYDCGADRRRILRDIVARGPLTEGDYLGPIRELIEDEKLRAAIDRELEETDAEFARYVRMSAQDPEAPEVRDKPPMYREIKRRQWWENQYREVDVEIYDERLRDVWPCLPEK